MQSITQTVKKKTLLRQMGKYTTIYVMMIPVVVYFLIFSFYPLVLSIIGSFEKEKLIGAADFAGLANYKEVLSDSKFFESVINAISIGGLGLIFNVIFGVVLAVIINEISNNRIKSSFQTITYLPYLFSWAVVGGIWVSMLSANGLINSILVLLGFNKIMFLSIESLGQPIMIVSNIWKNCGYYTVLILAAIVSIDPAIYESAQIDGANRIKQIFYIMIPNLFSTVKVLFLLGAMSLLSTFDQVFVMSRPAIEDKVRTILWYVYQTGFSQFKIGKATAATTLMLTITLIVSFTVRKITDYDKNYE